MEQSPNYRADIDGLRAVAVSSVLVFHAFPHLLPGGFVGVDIFFVISGFLISSIIFAGLDRGTFSILEFYGRRIRRILPALFLVLVAVFVLGWFFLFGDEYRELGKQMAGGAGFVSNFVLWAESGYFDEAATTKVLLHLWSLAIVAQFYMFWPPLLVLSWNRRGAVPALIGAALVLSFAANIWLVGHDAAAAFYSPAARAWELMAGCTLALLKRRGWQLRPANADVASTVGLILLVASFALVDDHRPFPGWWAVLPVLGAFLVIAAGADASLNRRILGHWAFVGIGLVSYPLYLWHWPLLTFARINESTTPSRDMRLAALALSLVAAVATYRLVELPIRHGTRAYAKAVALLALVAAMGMLGYACYRMNGFPGTGFRDPAREAFVDYFDNDGAAWRFGTRIGLAEKFRLECDFYNLESYRAHRATSVPLPSIAPGCTERDPTKRHAVLLWGDSHAQHLYWGLKQTLPPDWQILQVASSGCFPDPSASGPSTTNYCQQSNWVALQTIAKAKPDVVIVAQERGQVRRRFDEIAARIHPLGITRTLFAGPTPHWMTGLPAIVARELWPNPPRRTFVSYNPDIWALNQVLASQFIATDATAFVDIMGVFCNEAGCLTYLGDDPKTGLTSMDDAHLLPIASEYLARQLLARMVTGSVRD
jgi:peptidoglycan/LPS O-acetylase OafA/YrhL